MERFKSYIDRLMERVLDAKSPVIGFTIYSMSSIFSCEFARIIKEKAPDKAIIFGGSECFRSFSGMDILFKKSWIDAICFGEAEECLPNLLDKMDRSNDIQRCEGFAYRDTVGNIVDCGNPPLANNLDSLPFADFSHFDLTKYTEKMLPIMTSRGCIKRCVFCKESTHWRKYYYRDANVVYSEMTYQLNRYPSIREFWFNDSLLNGNIEMLDELSNLIIKNPLYIKWGGQAVIREEMTRVFLDKLRTAGCSTLIYGLETGSENILKLIRKGYTVETAEQVIRDTSESGIRASFNIIVGFPGEAEAEFQETVGFIKKNKKYAQSIMLNPLYLYIDSEMHNNKEKFGIVFTEGFDNNIYWRTVDNSNNYEERMRRLKICKEIIGENVSADLDKFSTKEKILKWHLHNSCQYRCPYCRLRGKWHQIKKLNTYLSPQEWMVHWKRLYDRYGSIRVEITGGEPFIYPDFIELIKELSLIHKVKITTNMSGDIETFVREISPERVNLDLNLHPLFVNDLDAYIKKCFF